MACHLCATVINGPRVDLLCSHSFHTVCFFGIDEDNRQCTCGQNILPDELYDEIRIRERAKEEAEQEAVAVELRASPEFNKNLRELRSCLLSVKRAQRSVFSLCREERRTFIALSRPFVEQILELQKTSLNNICRKEEYKTFRTAQKKVARKLRFVEQTYPRFNRRRIFLRIFRLPSPWALRMSTKFSNWKLKRFFKTLPKLF